MNPKMASRLARLRELTMSDWEALPEREAIVSPPAQSCSEDDNSDGGVALDSTARRSGAADADHASKRLQEIETQPPLASPSPTNPERRFIWMEGAASSYNLGAKPKLSSLPTKHLPPTTLSPGDLSRLGQYFAPLSAIAKYPYRYCNRNDSQDIATRFFDAGKFWAREWDIFYVWDIEGVKPLALVTEEQLQDLLTEINATLDLHLRITDQQREEGLVARFPDSSRCLPRYLGRSKAQTRELIDKMVSNAPDRSFQAAGETVHSPLTGGTLEEFKKIMEDMWDAQKNKNKAAREKKMEQRAHKQQDLVQRFKRAQRYLGLRPTIPGDLRPIDSSLPASFPFDQSIVFVCVDVESWERAHNKITEIGVATLDTRDLVNVPPGKDGVNWRDLIHARHFRINENKHLVNSEFVSGCPDSFMFGQSEFIPLKDAAIRVAACFKPPFCATDEGELFTKMMDSIDINEQRKLIFLGHDTFSDVRYLQQIGFNPLELTNMLETLDTASLYRVWRREQNPTSLGRILYDFDIAGYNLHNAGNDAVFTVQAMLAVCVREASIRGTTEMTNKREEDKAAKLASLNAEAQLRAREEVDGWSETEDNGGPPERIVVAEKPRLSEPTKPTPLSSVTFLQRGGHGRGRSSVVSDHRGGGRGGSAHRGNNGRGRGDRLHGSQPNSGYFALDGASDHSTQRGSHLQRVVSPTPHPHPHPRGRGRGRGEVQPRGSETDNQQGHGPNYRRSNGHGGGRARGLPHSRGGNLDRSRGGGPSQTQNSDWGVGVFIPQDGPKGLW